MKVSVVFLVFLAICGIQAWTVLQELTSNPQYSIFLEWLSGQTKSNLAGRGVSMTVFVPTNEAIQKFLKTHPIRADNSNWLTGIAEHCVVHGNLDSAFLKDKQSVGTGEDFPKLWIDVKNGHIYINNAKVTSSIAASNGHVHGLDAVIYPVGYSSTLKEEIDFGEDYSGLKSLLVNATEVGELLDDATVKFTVFSPNPKAVTDDIKAMNHTQLLSVIQRHLIKDQVLFSNLLIDQSTPVPTLENGAMINVQVLDNTVFVGSDGYWSMVERVDVSTSNGVIHVINGVLGVTSGVHVYQALGLFGSSEFRVISEATELKTDLTDNAKMFTVFSPQNTAWDNVSISDKTTLKKILKRHVLTGKLTVDELMKKTEVTTLSGDKLAVRIENGTVYLEFDNVKAEVTSTDKMASNGIIHIIDKVLTLAGRQTSVDITSTTETKETLSTSTDCTSVYIGVGVGLGTVTFALLGLIFLYRVSRKRSCMMLVEMVRDSKVVKWLRSILEKKTLDNTTSTTKHSPEDHAMEDLIPLEDKIIPRIS